MTTPIPRMTRERLLAAAGQQAVVGVTGPRQAGKTTLVRSCFPDHAYLNLEDPELYAFAQRDPKGFLSRGGGQARRGVPPQRASARSPPAHARGRATVEQRQAGLS